jgi:hypothetical protein
LITSNPTNRALAKARSLGIPLISEDWIVESIEQESPLTVTDFILGTQMGTF